MTATQARHATREQKAMKIARILVDFLPPGDLDGLRCLDVGSGNGVIARELARHFRRMIGLEFDRGRLDGLSGRGLSGPPAYVQADGMQIPFGNSTFEVVVCAQMYEHVACAERLADEVWRILRPGGICFFSGPNRLALIEDHYKLPFLSWLPLPWADRYLCTARGIPHYDIMPLTYWQLKHLWRRFEIIDRTAAILRSPEEYGVLHSKLRPIRRFLPLLIMLVPMLPNFNWILRKLDDGSN